LIFRFTFIKLNRFKNLIKLQEFKMKKLIPLLTLLLSIQMSVDSLAQELPLVYDAENTGSDWLIPYLPSINELPVIQSLPDPFKWADGRSRITNYSDWRYRRNEIKAQIEYYEIGPKPDRPDSITASYSNGTLTVNVTVNGKTLTLNSAVILPEGTGPFPAIIGMNSPSGSISSELLSSRNIARITYSHNQVTAYNNPQNTDPYYQLYPYLNTENTGQYSAWAWGVSRIIDGLELVQADLPIDLSHIAVTGCSYAGKMALFAGAFDERVALTLAIESGGGGATSWRYSGSEPSGTVEGVSQTSHQWFSEDLFQFGGNNVSKMPEDHHELMAMVAPRALYVTANPDYEWLSNPSCHVCSKAGEQVYNALGIADRFGFSIVAGHSHCAIPGSQTPEIEAFLDKFLLGDTTANTDIATSPYNIDLSPWITWDVPILSNGAAYYEWASLIYPNNNQVNLENNFNFQWNKVEDADKYFIQVAQNPTFTNIFMSDSTTDTVKSVTGLSDGNKYYWRVRVKNTNGSLGPWSEVWVFYTFIALPATPQLASASLIQNRGSFIRLTWYEAEGAGEYSVELSEDQSFTTVFKSTTTSDTVNDFTGLDEGQKYYWRVQANNVAGSSPWSDISDFTIIRAPTSLDVESSASNEITLSWSDKSDVEDGYIIERKQSPDTSFTVLDTLKESDVAEYVDNGVEQGKTYTYRVKAYKGSAVSDYSNEASLNLTDVNEEEGIPTEYSISQNYPNPFNPSTKIKFALPETALTKIIIYDLIGRKIQTLVNKELQAGYHTINIDAKNLPSGVYFYRIQSRDFIQTKKMILMK
jgi:fibronectin type 3 domain-containing protein